MAASRKYINGRDVSQEVGSEKIGGYAAAVANIEKVRESLRALQRGMAQKNNAVLEGRDIGTVVLPDADVKIFLTASAETRARRRSGDESRDYEEILREIISRDKQDEERAIAPLKPAADAVILDNSDLDEAETLSAALDIIKDKLQGKS